MFASVIFNYEGNKEAYESACCVSARRMGIETLAAAIMLAANRQARSGSLVCVLVLVCAMTPSMSRWPTVFGDPKKIPRCFWTFSHEAPDAASPLYATCTVEPLRIAQFTKVIIGLSAVWP